jgi:GntR family transcriptional regulator, arabinose operon transcriptional repressor
MKGMQTRGQWRTLAAQLSERINAGEWAAGRAIPGEEALASEYGVSNSTAHRALAELQREGLIVRKKRWGTVVADRSEQKRHLVALVFDRFAKQFDFPQGQLITGIQEILGEEYGIVWCDSRNDVARESHFLKIMAEQTDGIICHPMLAAQNGENLRRMVRHGFPLVLLDRIPQDFHGAAVLSDDFGSTQRAVSYLTQKGHRRIGFIGFHKPNISSVTRRYDGYTDALRMGGIEDTTRDVRWLARELESDPALLKPAVHDLLFTLLHQPEPITALYCIQDSLAVEALSVLDSFGIAVPSDLELVTVNEWPPLMLGRPWDVHRIVRRKHEAGQLAANLLLDQIAGKTIDPSIVTVPADFYPATLDGPPAVEEIHAWLADDSVPMEVRNP